VNHALQTIQNFSRLGRQVVQSYRGRSAPLEVGWDVTYRCNARCTYCTNWTTDYPDMPLDKVATLVDRIARLGTFQVSLSGGEQMMRKDLVEVVGLIKRAGMRCSMVTNGSISREPIFRALMQAGVDSITFSIDGSTKESHELFRRGTDFDRLLNSIRTCVKLRKEEGFATRLSTNTVLTNRNVEEVPKIGALVRSLGVDAFKFQPVWKQHFVEGHLKHADTENFNDVYGFTKDNEALLAKAVTAIETSGSANDPEFTRLIPDFYLGTEAAHEIACFAGRAFLFVDADGNVFPCGKVQRSFGNLLDDQWKTSSDGMFETPKARELKAEMTAQECGGCAAVAYMERNILLRSVKDPVKLAAIVARRVTR
jgi:radical SAM protein with 4Fe4S-binding SPASM domain